MRCIDDKGYPKDQLKAHGLENYAEERFWIILTAGHISCYKNWCPHQKIFPNRLY